MTPEGIEDDFWAHLASGPNAPQEEWETEGFDAAAEAARIEAEEEARTGGGADDPPPDRGRGGGGSGGDRPPPIRPSPPGADDPADWEDLPP